MESGVRCPECEKLTTDPVTLKCGHNICKECLNSLAPANEGASSLTSPEVPCSLCKVVAKLKEDGLAVRKKLSDQLEQRGPRRVGLQPPCHRCESAAFNFCTTCGTRSCKDCLKAFHPSEGPLAGHVVVALEECSPQSACSNAATRNTTDTEEPDGGDMTATTCRFHNLSLDTYCCDCELRICSGCLQGHEGHKRGSVKEVYNTRKEALEKEAQSARQVSMELKRIRSNIIELNREIQRRSRMEKDMIEANYENKVNELEAWRREAIAKVVEERRQEAMNTLASLRAPTHEKQKADDRTAPADDPLPGHRTVSVQVTESLTASTQTEEDDPEESVKESTLQQVVSPVPLADSRLQDGPGQLANEDNAKDRDE